MAARAGIAFLHPDIRTFAEGTFHEEAARFIAELVANSVANTGGCRIALAGGGTPAPVYRRLAKEPYRRQLAGDGVHWFWGDERAVPPDDPASNYASAHKLLLAPLGVPVANIHRMHGELDPPAAAAAYEEAIGASPLDLVLLGMGGDGHVASLFPGTEAMSNYSDRVVVGLAPVEPTQRISLGFRAINAAKEVVLLVTGAAKSQRLAEVRAEQRSGSWALPAACVRPSSGRLTWLLDEAAASAVKEIS